MSSQEDLLRVIPAASFQTSEKGYELTLALKKIFGVSTNAKIARLAIGRSLSEQSLPDLSINSKGNVIKGTNLFSLEESALWVGLLATHAFEFGHPEYIDLKSLQNLVKAHWLRGVELLHNDWITTGEDYNKFIELLVTRRAKLPLRVDNPEGGSSLTQIDICFNDKPEPVILEIGKLDNDSTFEWCINGVGYSPHVAIMGQAGAGKTRVLLNCLEQLHTKTDASIILVDLGKGDLADNNTLASTLNANILRVPEEPIPLDIFYMTDPKEENISDIVMSFRDSFSKVANSKIGAKQIENMRVALKDHFASNKKVSLHSIREALNNFYEENNISPDTVISTINDLTERKLFEPTLSPIEFFQKNWIITFGTALDTYKKLSIFLMLDALNYYTRSLPEAKTDSSGHRALRCVLAVDEARGLLAAKHLALSECIRLHRSKGLVVMLSSQSPDDYEGTSDDYLENIGLPICLKTNAKSTQVLQNMFKSKPNFSALKAGECLTLDKNKTVKLSVF